MAKSQTQTFLAFILAGILCIGFIGVWYVDAYYESNGETELLWESDSDMEYANLDVYPENEHGYNSQPCMRITGAVQEQYNRTPVYSGNNTWFISLNDTTENYVSGNLYIMLPNLDAWVIDDIVLNFTENNDDSYYTKMTIASFDYYDSSTIDSDSSIGMDIANSVDYEVGVEGDWFNRTIDVPLTESLQLYNNAQGKDNHIMYILYYDDGANWDGFTWQYTIKIYGTKVDSTSMIDQISIVIGASVIINIVAIIYLNDEYDLGGYRKDIKRRK